MRITSVRPRLDAKKGIVLTISVVARGVDDVNQLMENLEGTGAFKDPLPPEQHVNDQGLLEATVEAVYRPGDKTTDNTGGEAAMMLERRIFLEKRAILIPILVALAANLGVYLLVARPLAAKSAGAADRAAAARVSRQAAEADLASARALVTGKTRAENELLTFYDKVLPASQSARTPDDVRPRSPRSPPGPT